MATIRRGACRAVPIALLLTLLSIFSPLAAAVAAVDISFSVGDSVSSQDEGDVREAIRFAQDYLKANFASDPSQSLVVNIRNSSHPTNPGVVAFAGGEYLVVYSGSIGWTDSSPFGRLQVVVHEYVHVYQHDLIGLDDETSPAWLIEGTAEYLSFDAVVASGLVRARAVTDYQAWAVADGGHGIDLASVESLRAFQRAEGPVYPLSYLAIQFLVEDGRTADLDRYFREIANGADWRPAFAEVFGRDVDAFYKEFADWLRALIAPRSMPKVFRPIEVSDEPADVTIEEIADAVAVGEQTLVVAETDAATRCRLRLRSGNQPAVVSRWSVADATGLIFWLMTIPDDVPAGPATVTVSCGDTRDTATIDIGMAMRKQ